MMAMTSRSLLLVGLAWWIGLIAAPILLRLGFGPMQPGNVHWAISSTGSGLAVGVAAMTVATRLLPVETAFRPGVVAGLCFAVTGLGLDVHLRLADLAMSMPPVMTAQGLGAALGYTLAAAARDHFRGRFAPPS
jgi:hypothetical protein